MLARPEGILITERYSSAFFSISTVKSKYATLSKEDATALSYHDSSFDFVYSYHALEHISDPRSALSEMKRVLKPGGGFWIGTPNSQRLVGYLGSKKASWKQKLKWNASDWKAKIVGKFKNELGAHAGFSSKELFSLLTDTFSKTEEVTNNYYCEIYNNRRTAIEFLIKSKLSSVLFPGIYFTGKR